METQTDCWALTCAGHAQVTLCELCERAPAVVTCRADAATLCATCDAEIHSANRLARRHERVPVAPSSHDSAAAAWQEGMDPGAILGFYDPFLDLEYADGLVPIGGGGAPPAMMDLATGKPAFDSYNDGHLMSHCQISSSEIGLVPDAASTTSLADVSNPYSHPIPSSNPTATMDREARVMRYREKRKNRKFAKTIRYASRKAYAESRPRVKGRFVKRVEADSDADLVYSLGDNGYGLVPSF